MSKNISIELSEVDALRFDHAMADALCWLGGFTAAGGTYSPDSIGTLKDLRDVIQRSIPRAEDRK